jgi:hypothetical protein
VFQLQQNESRGSDLRNTAGVEADPAEGLELVLSRVFARSPTPWMPRMTLLKTFWFSVSSPPLGFLIGSGILRVLPRSPGQPE